MKSRSRLFYGYYIVFACFSIMFLTMGMIIDTLGIFLKPMVEDLGSGRGAVSLAMIMGGGCMAFLAPVTGKIIDRIGVRPVMSTGILVAALELFTVSLITQVWQIYVAFCLIWSGVAFTSVIPCSLVISNWFVTRRGLAMGLMAMGAYEGIKRIGAIDGYDCGIFARMAGWLDGLGLEYKVDPPLTGCLMHSHGQCHRDFRFKF